MVLKYSGRKRLNTSNVCFNGLNITIPDNLSFLWQYYDIFTEENYQFQSNQTDITIFDVGSNIGISCLYFSKQFPKAKIFAFEADPAIADILEKNLKQNQINNVTVYKAAAWIHNDGINLSPDGADGASIIENGKTIKVPSVKLKQLLESHDRIDFLKMDIEGAETEVLLDCSSILYKIENIFIEYHSFIGHQQSMGQILQLLETSGFRYHLISVNHRSIPFVNRQSKNNNSLDLQTNIYAYR